MPETGPVDSPLRGRPVSDLDGGVSRRVVRRCRTAAAILLALAASLLLVVLLAPWSVSSSLATVGAGALLLGSGLLLRRGVLWSAAARSEVPGSPINTFTIGPTKPMSPGLAGAPVKRRLKSSVVPIYATDGRSPGDGALVVHARADGEALTEGDSVQVWRVGNAGLEPLDEALARGRFVVYRGSSDAAFLATTRLTDTW